MKFRDFIDVRDGTHDSPKSVSGIGYPLVTTKHLGNGFIDLSNTNNISEEDYITINKRSKVDQFDILISMIGTVGSVYQERQSQPGYAIKNVGLLKFNGDETLSNYVYYWLKSSNGQNEIKVRLKGTTQQFLSLTELRNLTLELPSREEMNLAVKPLMTLDQKMYSLGSINDNLLELALTEYRQKVETTATTQMKLGDIAKVSAGGDKPKLVSNLASDEMRVPIYSNGITNEGLYGFTDTPKIFDKAVTVSARGTIGYLAIREEPYYPIVRLISVIPTLGKFTIHQLYLALTDTNIQGFGTTQQQLTVPVFKSTMLPILPEETRTEIEELISPMFDMIAHNKHEIVTLSETRDSLLKKLI